MDIDRTVGLKLVIRMLLTFSSKFLSIEDPIYPSNQINNDTTSIPMKNLRCLGQKGIVTVHRSWVRIFTIEGVTASNLEKLPRE